MDISRINELLQENEQIRTKIIELKRKLNLKNYNSKQKEELKDTIKNLKEAYILNQSKCCNLSEMKAGTFARLVCKHLNKLNLNYKIKCACLNLPTNTKEFISLKHLRGQTKSNCLVITNREIKPSDEISLNDFGVIPIAYSQNYFISNMINDYAILENKIISLFESPDNIKDCYILGDIKTFNLGKAGETNKSSNSFLKLKNQVKEELGIWAKQKEIKEEKQL